MAAPIGALSKFTERAGAGHFQESAVLLSGGLSSHFVADGAALDQSADRHAAHKCRGLSLQPFLAGPVSEMHSFLEESSSAFLGAALLGLPLEQALDPRNHVRVGLFVGLEGGSLGSEMSVEVGARVRVTVDSHTVARCVDAVRRAVGAPDVGEYQVTEFAAVVSRLPEPAQAGAARW